MLQYTYVIIIYIVKLRFEILSVDKYGNVKIYVKFEIYIYYVVILSILIPEFWVVIMVMFLKFVAK
jgi:hypothetical protein